MKIDELITEIKIIINNELYENNLITYSEYIKVLKEVRKKKIC